ncbi:DUF305 domain-containing protein [Spirillospora albida]|uniref:DUF305 domain-containing protein n=1 Tax=Spirillospora albida TaxID=58123 RepID=UPI0004BECFBD|nr:DUF305 domain-containing protein [Spirillospora albida]
MTRRIRAIALLATAPLLLTAACGGDGEATGSKRAATGAPSAVTGPGSHNATDVMYLQMMIAHHRQGLQMAGLAARKAPGADVRRLAKAVHLTQTDEVKLMTSWLRKWNKPLTVDHAPSAHADHGGLPATSAKEIGALRVAKGARFQNAFLNLFIGHQSAAVEMAKMETGKGVNGETKAFATRLTASRQDQIKQMLVMLNR